MSKTTCFLSECTGWNPVYSAKCAFVFLFCFVVGDQLGEVMVVVQQLIVMR